MKTLYNYIRNATVLSTVLLVTHETGTTIIPIRLLWSSDNENLLTSENVRHTIISLVGKIHRVTKKAQRI